MHHDSRHGKRMGWGLEIMGSPLDISGWMCLPHQTSWKKNSHLQPLLPHHLLIFPLSREYCCHWCVCVCTHFSLILWTMLPFSTLLKLLSQIVPNDQKLPEAKIDGIFTVLCLLNPLTFVPRSWIPYSPRVQGHVISHLLPPHTPLIMCPLPFSPPFSYMHISGFFPPLRLSLENLIHSKLRHHF